ncbi:MAG: hypothetical protein Q9171_001334 [Xanthocarpia ochracea]
MGSATASSALHSSLTKSASAESGPPRLLSARRQAPTPSLSFNSLNVFQAPRSNVSSPGSLYLSPPLSTPSFMSPPPRLEAEDYLSSLAGRKKHSSRPGALAKSSPLVGPRQPLHLPNALRSDERTLSHDPVSDSKVGIVASAPNVKAVLYDVDNETQRLRQPPYPCPIPTDSQKPPKETERSSMCHTQEINESPAVISLRRLSEFGEDSRARISSEISKTSQLIQSDEDQITTNPKHGLRKRSTASQDQRRLGKIELSTAFLGLDIPTTITLRKATGLFQIGPGLDPGTDAHILADQSHHTKEGSTSSPTTCMLVGFDSRSLSSTDQITNRENDEYPHKPSGDKANDSGLPVLHSLLNLPMSSDSRRQSLAETAVTVSNSFPSPAILASPLDYSSSVNEVERRFSVVHIKSRKSLHQVIWREDDTSSSSETSSKSVSPTRPASIKQQEASENSSMDKSPASSKTNVRQTSSPALSEHRAFTPDALLTAEKLIPFKAAEVQPQGQMLQWSWGVADDVLYDPMDCSKAAKSSHGTPKQHDQSEASAPGTMVSAIPRLSIPIDVEAPDSRLSPGIPRRGSFVVDTTSLASITSEREAGSRRSISITPFMLSKLGVGGPPDDHDGGHASRRFSKVA